MQEQQLLNREQEVEEQKRELDDILQIQEPQARCQPSSFIVLPYLPPQIACTKQLYELQSSVLQLLVIPKLLPESLCITRGPVCLQLRADAEPLKDITREACIFCLSIQKNNFKPECCL